MLTHALQLRFRRQMILQLTEKGCGCWQTTLGPDGHTLVPLNPYTDVLTGRWPNLDAAAVLRPHIPYCNVWNLTSMLWNFHRWGPCTPLPVTDTRSSHVAVDRSSRPM